MTVASKEEYKVNKKRKRECVPYEMSRRDKRISKEVNNQ